MNQTAAAQLALQTLLGLSDFELVFDFYSSYLPDVLDDLERNSWEEIVNSVKKYKAEFPDEE